MTPEALAYCEKQTKRIAELEQKVAALTEQRNRAEQQVREVLWDDPTPPSFGPAFGDLLTYLNHQNPHPTEIYKMMADGAKLWNQMKDQVAALTKELDELEISNAFAHGEWRAAKDQLAALRVDAERYRWLRRDAPYDECAYVFDLHTEEELDAAIDAAMGDKAAIRGLA